MSHTQSSEPRQVSPQNEWQRIRALVRPAKCSGGPKCWVEHGLGHLTYVSRPYGCLGCRGVPRLDTPAFYHELTMLLAREAHDHR